MKPLLLLAVALMCAAGYSQETKLLASCCEGKEATAKEFGRCSGDASCTACSNCRYCKHCSKEGGSCGVCAPAPAPKPKAKAKANKAAKAPSQYRKNQMIEVTAETVNLRSGAGENYPVIQKLSEGAMLTFISYEGDWLYVRVDATGKNGYVYYKFVK